MLNAWFMHYDLPIRLRNLSTNTQEQTAQTTTSEPSVINERRNSNTSNPTGSTIEGGEMQHNLHDHLRRMSISRSGTRSRRRNSRSTSNRNRHQEIARRRFINRPSFGSRVVGLTPIRRRSSYRALTRGPPVGRHHRRILAAQASQQMQSRMMFLRALLNRAAENRRLPGRPYKSNL
jgi:hypothetical protein